MITNKVQSKKDVTFAKGGSQHMYEYCSTGPQVPGQTAQMGRSNDKFAKGGSTKMFGKQAVKPARAK